MKTIYLLNCSECGKEIEEPKFSKKKLCSNCKGDIKVEWAEKFYSQSEVQFINGTQQAVSDGTTLTGTVPNITSSGTTIRR